MEEKLQELRHAAQTEYYEKAGTKARELLSATFTKNTSISLCSWREHFIALALWYSLSRRTNNVLPNICGGKQLGIHLIMFHFRSQRSIRCLCTL